MKLNNCKQEIIDLWQSGQTLQLIANRYAVSKTAVKLALNKWGYNTGVVRIHVMCNTCDKVKVVPPSQVKDNNYCSPKCYQSAQKLPEYTKRRLANVKLNREENILKYAR